MSHAAAGVLVHDVNELRDRVLAVAYNVTRGPAGGGDQLTMDDERAMIVAFEESLHNDRAGMLASDCEAVNDFLVGHEPDGYTAAVIAVVGLGYDREADAPGSAHGLPFRLHQLLGGNGQAQSGQDLVGFFLVAGQ